MFPRVQLHLDATEGIEYVPAGAVAFPNATERKRAANLGRNGPFA
ncbi:MAG: hypothetical protein QF682_08980 [Candidatus Thermoplasmatota archaeon]|nr:hypothetical protein [Candidatus Thermoplasmatota archaeon]